MLYLSADVINAVVTSVAFKQLKKNVFQVLNFKQKLFCGGPNRVSVTKAHFPRVCRCCAQKTRSLRAASSVLLWLSSFPAFKVPTESRGPPSGAERDAH